MKKRKASPKQLAALAKGRAAMAAKRKKPTTTKAAKPRAATKAVKPVKKATTSRAIKPSKQNTPQYVVTIKSKNGLQHLLISAKDRNTARAIAKKYACCQDRNIISIRLKKEQKTPNKEQQTKNTKQKTPNNKQQTKNTKQKTTNKEQQTKNTKQQTTNKSLSDTAIANAIDKFLPRDFIYTAIEDKANRTDFFFDEDGAWKISNDFWSFQKDYGTKRGWLAFVQYNKKASEIVRKWIANNIKKHR